tara:strand:- start:3402 stop:3530 length:129 start_codon:yes stop_codon:yes gene_type:complete
MLIKNTNKLALEVTDIELLKKYAVDLAWGKYNQIVNFSNLKL